jgi:DNA-binding response OmpR family regulator
MKTSGRLHGLTVLAIYEEKRALQELVFLLSEDPRVERVFQASDAVSAVRLLNAQQANDAVNIVFLGLRMPGLDGFELAHVFSLMTDPPSVVFVTPFDQAIDAYEIGAIDYLTQPVGPGRLTVCIDRVLANRSFLYLDGGRPTESPERIFLCHSSGDKKRVRELHNRLTRDGLSCWFDEEDLLPGQDWELEISRVIQASGFVLACLSHQSINKRGYIQKELKKALDVADEQPEGATFLIPVRLEPCAIPQRLRRWQWVDLFATTGYPQLLRALHPEPNQIKIDTEQVDLLPKDGD